MKITHVAIMLNGITYSLPAPNRHHHVIRLIRDTGIKKQVRGNQGFLTEDGAFIERKPAAILALETGQVTQLDAPPSLFSEDLW